MNFKDKAIALSDLIRLPKQYGTVLLLCPTLWSLVLASNGKVDIKILFVFIAGCFLMRSAGCAVNDLADRKFDIHVDRTQHRPIASGRLTPLEGVITFTLLSLFALMLVLLLNDLTVKLSFAAIVLAVIYPFVKRFSHFPQIFLGASFGWGAIMAWSAVTNQIALPAILFFSANIFWATAYDTIYALMDIDDDKKIGVKSTAIFFGNHVYMAVLISYTLTIILLGLAGLSGGLGIVYIFGILITYVIFILITINITNNPSRENLLKSFISNVYAGLLVLLSIIIDIALGLN